MQEVIICLFLDFVTFKVIANWLVKEPELIILSRPSTAKIITSMLKAVSASELDHADAWKLHFAMIESFQHRKLASMGVKRPTVPSYMERVSSDNLPPLLRLRLDLFHSPELLLLTKCCIPNISFQEI